MLARVCLVGFYLTSIFSFAHGADAMPSRAIESAIDEALRNNPELRGLAQSIAAARGEVRTAGTIRNPELNAQLGYKNTRDKSGSTLGEGAAWSLSLNQRLEYPGRVAFRKAIASGDVELAQLHLRQFRVVVAARVRTLAYSMLIAQEKSSAAREVANRFQSLADILSQRASAGVTAVLEARVIESNAIIFRRRERDAALAATTALAELNQLRGRALSEPFPMGGSQLGFAKVSLPSLLDAARRNAFDIRIREAELVQQGLKVSLTKNERYPTFSIGPFYSQENAADKEQQAGVGVSVPLPLWDRNAGNIATSQARKQQAEAALLSTRREVERRVIQNAAVFQARREEIEKWQADTLAKFRETAELADRNYLLGAVPISTYIETQKQYFEVLETASDLKKDALQAAQELEILAGFNLCETE